MQDHIWFSNTILNFLKKSWSDSLSLEFFVRILLSYELGSNRNKNKRKKQKNIYLQNIPKLHQYISYHQLSN